MGLLRRLFGGLQNKGREPVALRHGEYMGGDKVCDRLCRKIVSILRKPGYSNAEKRFKILEAIKAIGYHSSVMKHNKLEFCDCGYPLGGYEEVRGTGGWLNERYTSFSSILIYVRWEGDPWEDRRVQCRCPNCGKACSGDYITPSR